MSVHTCKYVIAFGINVGFIINEEFSLLDKGSYILQGLKHNTQVHSTLKAVKVIFLHGIRSLEQGGEGVGKLQAIECKRLQRKIPSKRLDKLSFKQQLKKKTTKSVRSEIIKAKSRHKVPSPKTTKMAQGGYLQGPQMDWMGDEKLHKRY